ncbi:hypothetical protein B9Z55_000274 [Caenorhabditis nigoni]|uniref:Uncharacterized protein n=1 Tax=Caenorhabditis nigoni TaxID=1611254 RepID=A0A2G5VLW4_9PELO|nr:hypothetical protein B9Z55_000274 [Caenorhabditis nigoni]
MKANKIRHIFTQNSKSREHPNPDHYPTVKGERALRGHLLVANGIMLSSTIQPTPHLKYPERLKEQLHTDGAEYQHDIWRRKLALYS